MDAARLALIVRSCHFNATHITSPSSSHHCENVSLNNVILLSNMGDHHCKSMRSPVPSKNHDAAAPQMKRKPGRPRKEDTSTPSTKIPKPASPVPSSQTIPDATAPSTKKKPGRPRKEHKSTPSKKIPTCAAIPISRTNPGAAFAPTPTPRDIPSRPRCRLDVLNEQQRRQSGADEAGPRRARVLRLPPLKSEPAGQAHKRPKHLSIPATTTPSLLFEGDGRSQVNNTPSSFERGFQNYRLPSPPKPGQVLGNSTLSIILGQEITDKNRGLGVHLIPVAFFSQDDQARSLCIPDRYDSKEALIFCGLADDVSATYSEEWKRHGRPGTLGIYALEKIKETATKRGFNPWACSEIGRANLWNRIRNMNLTPVYRDILLDNIMPNGKGKWNWEKDWSSSLRDLGLVQPLIDEIQKRRYADMRAHTPVSHWAYNYVERMWNSLPGYDKRIHNAFRRNLDAAKRKSEEEERQREEREQELFDLQRWARRNPHLPGTAEIEGHRIAELVRPRSPSLLIEVDLFPIHFEGVPSGYIHRGGTGDGEDTALDWMEHMFDTNPAAHARPSDSSEE